MARLLGSIAWMLLAPLALTGCGGGLSAADAQEDGSEASAHIGRYTLAVTIDGQAAGVFEGVEGLTIEVDIPERHPALDVRVVNSVLPVETVGEVPDVEDLEPPDVEVDVDPEAFEPPDTASHLPISDYNRVVPGGVRYRNVILKKGALYAANTQPEEDELWRDWFGSIVELGSPPQAPGLPGLPGLPSPRPPTLEQLAELTRSGSITVFDAMGTEVASYQFSGAWPCRVSGFQIDANGQAVTGGEIELVVTTLTIRDRVRGTPEAPSEGGDGGGGSPPPAFPFFKPRR